MPADASVPTVIEMEAAAGAGTVCQVHIEAVPLKTCWPL